MSYNNLNNYTPFGFRDSLSLVTSKVQEIQVGYMHPYRISLTGSNLTYTASQLLNNSIDRYQTADPSGERTALLLTEAGRQAIQRGLVRHVHRRRIAEGAAARRDGAKHRELSISQGARTRLGTR